MNSKTVFQYIATRLGDMNLNRPIRVAVDGRTAAGKTTFANKLENILQESGREIIRTSVHGFHNPRSLRYVRGRFSSDGYFYDARNLPAMKRLLLEPLGPEGDLIYATSSFDLENDKPLQPVFSHASSSSILVVDGSFLLRDELNEHWDLRIFLKTSEAVAHSRGVKRDSNLLGGLEPADHLYRSRYAPAFDLYERLCNPILRADIIVGCDNEYQIIEKPCLHQ